VLLDDAKDFPPYGRRRVREANDCHEPAGSPNGGQFCSKGGGVTATPAFKRWFGQSKVTDAVGQPLRVYHGTRATQDFVEFRGRVERPFANKPAAELVWFAGDPEVTDVYAGADLVPKVSLTHWKSGRVIPAYIRIENPLRVWIRPNGKFEADGEVYSSFFGGVLEAAISRGHDGVIVQNYQRGFRPAYAVFSPQQIKSALSNRTFDPTSKKFTETEMVRRPA
jgi:hypothetical protein